jgi:hypothetical protein
MVVGCYLALLKMLATAVAGFAWNRGVAIIAHLFCNDPKVCISVKKKCYNSNVYVCSVIVSITVFRLSMTGQAG